MADFTSQPAETIRRKFSISGSATGGDTTSPPIPPTSTADLSQQPLPQGPSQAQIAAFYQPLLDQVQNEAQPLSRPVPAQISPLGTFLGLLAGNLASTFSQNPAFAHQAQTYLAEETQKRQAIEEQNYADSLASSTSKRNRLTAIRGQILEKTLDEAIKSGDLGRADIASKNLFSFQEGIRRESQKQEADQRKALIQVQGAEDRKTNAAKATLTAEEEAAKAAKGPPPLTTKDYLGARNAVARNKELDEKTHSRWKAFGITLPFGPRDATPTEREEEAEGIDVATIKNGEPVAVRAAKANLKRSMLKRLGFLGTTATSEAREAVRQELEKYGLTPADLR